MITHLARVLLSLALFTPTSPWIQLLALGGMWRESIDRQAELHWCNRAWTHSPASPYQIKGKTDGPRQEQQLGVLCPPVIKAFLRTPCAFRCCLLQCFIHQSLAQHLWISLAFAISGWRGLASALFWSSFCSLADRCQRLDYASNLTKKQHK